MKKYKVQWKETNVWECIVEANSKDEAIEKLQQDGELVVESQEADDSFVEAFDYTAEEITDEDESLEAIKTALEELDMNYTIIKMETVPETTTGKLANVGIGGKKDAVDD